MTPKDSISRLINGIGLTSEQMLKLVDDIMRGETAESVIGAILVLLRQKGESIDEILGAVEAVFNRAEKITLSPDAVDTCGTGGDTAGTFNISTVASIIANAAGVKIAKHGNRSADTQSGSADVLESLGLNLTLPKEQTEHVFNQTGYAFLYAPRYHKFMKTVALARRELGIRTIFNMVGPLVNPAGVTRQLIGVYDKALTGMFAQVLRQRGAEHCLIVNGQTKEGAIIDEPNLCGSTFVAELKDGTVSNYTITPEEFGFKRRKIEEIRGGSLEENQQIILDILNGRATDAQRDAAIFAGGMAIYVGGKSPSLAESFSVAREALNSGVAKRSLDAIIAAHHEATIAR
jgi:anthranilate phosphoribosyltransferase